MEQRLAGDGEQDFARKAGGGEAGGNDSQDAAEGGVAGWHRRVVGPLGLDCGCQLREQLFALHVAVGCDGRGDDGDEDDREDGDEDVEEMECAVEAAGGVVRVDGTVGFLGEKRHGSGEERHGGGEFVTDSQCRLSHRFDLRCRSIYHWVSADVAAPAA